MREDSLINKWGPTQPVGGASPGSIFAAAMGDHDHGSFLSPETDPVLLLGRPAGPSGQNTNPSLSQHRPEEPKPFMKRKIISFHRKREIWVKLFVILSLGMIKSDFSWYVLLFWTPNSFLLFFFQCVLPASPTGTSMWPVSASPIPQPILLISSLISVSCREKTWQRSSVR